MFDKYTSDKTHAETEQSQGRRKGIFKNMKVFLTQSSYQTYNRLVASQYFQRVDHIIKKTLKNLIKKDKETILYERL